MSLSEHVSLTITTDSVGIARAGFGTPMILSVNAAWSERIRYYTDIPGVAADFATTSPEYLAATAMFSQTPHPALIAIGRAVGKPTQRYQLNISSVVTGSTYGVNVVGQGVTATTCSFTSLSDITFTAANSGDLFTSVAHGMATGDGPYRMTGGSIPTGTAVDTNYWIIRTSADVFQIADTKAHAIALTATTISADGSGTLVRGLNDVICAQLVQALNAVVGKNYTAVQTEGALETDYIVVTTTTAGNWLSLEVSNVALIKIAQTHAEPGTTLATDLDAIQLENGDWYGMVTLYNSEAYVKAVAAWAEAQTKIYIADTSDSESVTLAAAGTGTSDLADDLRVSAYARTAVAYHPSPSEMMGAAWLGRMLPLEPGSDNWKFKTLAGVAAVTTTGTHRVNLRAKKANSYTTVAGRNITWEGFVSSGDFIDNTRGVDWLEDDMTKGVFGALAGLNKVPFTDAGIALIQNEVEASLARAVSRGILADDPKPVVTVPKAADVASSDKALRLLPDVKFSGTLAGAINKVTVQGTISV